MKKITMLLVLSGIWGATAARADDRELYRDIIAPILQDKCTKCHGTEKAKGKLRLHTYEMIMKGGEDGKIIKPGDSAKSTIYKNLTLPKGDDDHMPPKEKPQPTAAEIAAIKWWVEKGAPEHMKISEAGDIPDDAKPAIEAKK